MPCTNRWYNHWFAAHMRPRYSIDFLDRTYGGQSAFDLWSLLTTLERHASLPERSWLFCRLVEWMSSTRSGVWTYYEATSEALQSQISRAIQRYPELHAISEHFGRGMRTWRSEQEIGHVDQWLDSHEGQLHASLMQFAQQEKALVMKLNGEQDGPANRSQPVGPQTNQTSSAADSGG
jgi:hypothetical protein